MGTIFRRKRMGKTRAEVRFDGMAGCLRTPKGGNSQTDRHRYRPGTDADAMDVRPRVCPPTGCQTFPLVANNIQNLYGFGDAVCVPVIRWIDEHILSPVFEWKSSQRKDRGSNLTPEQRRKTMQAVKGKNTSLEKMVAAAFWRKGWRYRRNYSSLPGKPDLRLHQGPSRRLR